MGRPRSHSGYSDPACIDNADHECSKPGGRITRGLCGKHYNRRQYYGTLPEAKPSNAYRTTMVYNPARTIGWVH